jgi:hypothetical protein
MATSSTLTVIVAWDRDESDPCEHGTAGCSTSHADSPVGAECAGW